MTLFSIPPTFIQRISNTEFNYAEHLNKQYLTANYSAPWKPLANKLAMLMWECVLIFLAVCAYKGSSTAPPTYTCTHAHAHTRSQAFWAIVDWWIKQIGLDLRIKKEISLVSLPPLPQTRVIFRLHLPVFAFIIVRSSQIIKNDVFDYRQPYFSFSWSWAILVDISASRQNNEKLPWEILARLLPCVLIGQRPNIPSLKRD